MAIVPCEACNGLKVHESPLKLGGCRLKNSGQGITLDEHNGLAGFSLERWIH